MNCPLLYSMCTLTGSPHLSSVSHLPVCRLARRFYLQRTNINTPLSSLLHTLAHDSLPFFLFTNVSALFFFSSSFLVIYLCLLGFFDQFVCFISPGATLSLKLCLTLSLNSLTSPCFVVGVFFFFFFLLPLKLY